jgi:hypothetical protein
MRLFFDTEFIEDGRTIDLISIGIVREDGATYYAESSEIDLGRASKWVVENVFPSLTGDTKPRAQIAADVIRFAGPSPEFWAYFASYDWVALCQLYGRMLDIPSGWPMFPHDLKAFAVEHGIPLSQDDRETRHNALDDALWLQSSHARVMKLAIEENIELERAAGMSRMASGNVPGTESDDSRSER